MICTYWAWFYTVRNGYYGKMLKVGDAVRNGIYGKIPFKKLPIFRDGLRRSRTVSDYIWFCLDIARNGNYGLILCVFFWWKKKIT